MRIIATQRWDPAVAVVTLEPFYGFKPYTNAKKVQLVFHCTFLTVEGLAFCITITHTDNLFYYF